MTRQRGCCEYEHLAAVGFLGNVSLLLFIPPLLPGYFVARYFRQTFGAGSRPSSRRAPSFVSNDLVVVDKYKDGPHMQGIVTVYKLAVASKEFRTALLQLVYQECTDDFDSYLNPLHKAIQT